MCLDVPIRLHYVGFVRIPLRLLTAFASLTIASCSLANPPTQLPEIETFRVDLALESNTCGFGGLQLQAVSQLNGVLRGYAGGGASWHWTSQSGTSVGSATSAGSYQFTDVTTYEQVPPDTTINYPGCAVTQRTELTFTVTPVPTQPVDAGVIDGSVDSGVGDAGDAGDVDAGTDAGVDAGIRYVLTGTMRFDVVPTSDSDCSPLLSTWEAIPCHAVLDLTGVPAP